MDKFWEKEGFLMYELTDEEIENLTSDEIYEMGCYLDAHPVLEEATIKGLLKKFNLKYDDLPKWLLDTEVGIRDTANRTDRQIYINRKDSKFKDNIKINLNPNRDVPYVTIQTQISEDFIHEEAYDENGSQLYQS